jgi:cytosine/adenosine deaminase-related metal-dependent hydrolase
VRELFDGCDDYLASLPQHGLVGRRSVFAHNVHADLAELEVMAAQDATVAHCPTSNAALGSGLFPLREHVERGVRVALGSDVGAGTGFSLFKEGLQAYFVQQVLGDRGLPLTPAHLLHLATSAGADALGLGDAVGDFSVASSSTPSGCARSRVACSRSGSGTRRTPPTRWARRSRWPARATSRACSWRVKCPLLPQAAP